MHFKHRVLSVVTIWLGAVGSGLAAQNHRVLIVDVLTEQGGTTSRLVVLEVESGKIIAEAETGEGPDIGISAQNDLVAVATFNRVGGRYLANDRMDIFASSDLRHLQKGVLPFGARIGFQRYAPLPTLAFSPDGKEIIVQRMESFLSDEKPFRWQVNNGLWGFVKRELDQEGTFKQSRPDVKVPRCRHADFLKVSDWPRVYIWNPNLAVVEGVDVNTGKILNRLPLDYDDDNALRVIAPEFLEKPAIGELYMHLGANGLVIPGGATYAYYIPRPTRNPEIQPGFIQKIESILAGAVL